MGLAGIWRWFTGAAAALARREVLRLCFEHTLDTVGAMLFFKIGAYAADRLVDPGWVWLVHIIENSALTGILIWLVVQLGLLLWNNRVKVKVNVAALLVFA